MNEGRNREPGKTVNEVKPSLIQKPVKDEEENWGQKCDIEFVDSEEDFDEIETNKKGSTLLKQLPSTQKSNIIERASISFSLQKKPGPSIKPNVDLDDLPLKNAKTSGNNGSNQSNAEPVIEDVMLPQERKTEEIVISSDSEGEEKTQSAAARGGESTSSPKDKASVALPNKYDYTNLLTKKGSKPDISKIEENKSDKVNSREVAERSQNLESEYQKQNVQITPESNKGKAFKTKMRVFSQNDHETDKDNNQDNLMEDVKGKSADQDDQEQQADEMIHEEKTAEPISKSKNDNSESSSTNDDQKKELTDEHQADIAEKEKLGNVQDQGDLVEPLPDNFKEQERNSNSDSQNEPNEFVQNDENTENSKGIGGKENESLDALGEKASNVSVNDDSSLKISENMTTGTENRKQNQVKATMNDDEAQERPKEPVEDRTENFYKGVEHLTFTDDSKDQDLDVEELKGDDHAVQPIRIETGLIRKPVLRHPKIEMKVPEKSWGKKEKKKKEKSKDVLVMEGIGYLKTTLSENSASCSSQVNSEGTVNVCEAESTSKIEEAQAESAASISKSSACGTHTEPNSQDSQETSLSSQDDVISYEEYEPNNDSEGRKKGGSDTEIIGVIEASNDPSNDQFDLDLGGSSWSMRWLQSEKVQKVVTSSKMLSRVRKKIQKKDKATKASAPEKAEDSQKKLPEPQVSVIGSIEEYERLFGMKVTRSSEESKSAPENESAEGTEQISEYVEEIPTTSKKVPAFGSDDEGEDSEEEALWSKIIGK